MALSFSECSLEEWASQAQTLFSKQKSNSAYIEANLFCRLQFIDEELERRNYRGYSASLDGVNVAWASAQNISDEVIHVRSIIVDSAVRGRGVGTFLVRSILNICEGKCKKVIIFAQESKVSFYEKLDFKKEDKFVPRRVILFNEELQKYEYEGECLHLMSYRF